jgi:hypothetical protein
VVSPKSKSLSPSPSLWVLYKTDQQKSRTNIPSQPTSNFELAIPPSVSQYAISNPQLPTSSPSTPHGSSLLDLVRSIPPLFLHNPITSNISLPATNNIKSLYHTLISLFPSHLLNSRVKNLPIVQKPERKYWPRNKTQYRP